MNEKLKNKHTDAFFSAVLNLRSTEECYDFFEDICTVAEIQAMAQRLYVAMLLEEKRTYQEISTVTGASTATISRINKCLEYGTDGYKTALRRLKNNVGD